MNDILYLKSDSQNLFLKFISDSHNLKKLQIFLPDGSIFANEIFGGVDNCHDNIALVTRDFHNHFNPTRLYLNNKGEIIAEVSYGTPFNNGFAGASDLETNKWGILNEHGTWVFLPAYSWMNEFSEGIAAYHINGERGFIRFDGKIITPALFNSTTKFIDGYAGIEKDGHWGIIDREGKIIFEPLYSEISLLGEGIIALQVNYDEYELINMQTGKHLVRKLNYISNYHDGLASFSVKT